MIGRFAQFPRDLARRTRHVTLGGVPALIAHPDWRSPAPVMVWMHGRTANKEIDPGRYLRWVRAGIAAVALDLPGHGQRPDARLRSPEGTLDLIAQMVGEIDRVVDACADPGLGSVLDLERMGIGGMSAGGMCALRRLCEGHDFQCAAVECSTGWLHDLYSPSGFDSGRAPWGVSHAPERVKPLDPMAHLGGFEPLPILFLHAETDRVIPIANVRRFIAALTDHYRERSAGPELITLRTWRDTGAPEEHAGFGTFGNEAKNVQVEFLQRVLRATPPPPEPR